MLHYFLHTYFKGGEKIESQKKTFDQCACFATLEEKKVKGHIRKIRRLGCREKEKGQINLTKHALNKASVTTIYIVYIEN